MKWVVLILLISHSIKSDAQTWAEWMRQKKTQRKYLIQQIAALQVYFEYGKQGYDIADRGLGFIRSRKNGEYKLHQDYFTSLQAVNPAIKNWQKVVSIIVGQLQILKLTKEALNNSIDNGQLTSSEIASCRNTIDNLLSDCLNVVEELVNLISPTEHQMKDNERIQRIEALYAEMQDQKTFAMSFCGDMELLTTRRMIESIETKRSRILNGIK